MSSQPSQAGRLFLEPSGVGEELVFGDDPQSSLAIPKALIAQLWAQVNKGTRMLARGGLEVGGLLVGPKVRGGRVVVDRIIPLPIEYRHGPSFRMSPSDLATIAPAIESAQDDLSKVVVGFYRSRTRGDETLRESDHEVFDAIAGAHTSFAADFRCCFVLAPTSESVTSACIAMRNGAGWHEMQPFTLRSNPLSIIAFPPSTALRQVTHTLHAGEQALHSPVSSAPLPPAPEQDVLKSVVSDPPAAARGGTRRVPIWLYAVAGLVVVAAVASAYVWTVKKQPQPVLSVHAAAAPSRTHLGFSATLENPVWKLSWDRAAMDELNPAGAVLSIKDGAVEQQVPLAPADLASGTIFYTPVSDDLSFSLRVDRGGTPVEEHVRVLGAPRIVKKPIDRVPQPVPTKAPVEPPAKSRGPVPPIKQLAVAASRVVPAAPSKPAIAPPPDADVSFLPAPVAQPTIVALAVAVPPTIDAPRAATPPIVPTPSRGEPNAVVVAPSAVPPTPTSALAPPKTNYVGPRPIQQVRPEPTSVPSGVSQVQVLVEIDARGKVTKASPVGWTATNAPLMVLAVRAASSWRFDPAQLDGQAVASQMNLTFRVNGLPPR